MGYLLKIDDQDDFCLDLIMSKAAIMSVIGTKDKILKTSQKS
jgi:hypothetical protein